MQEVECKYIRGEHGKLNPNWNKPIQEQMEKPKLILIKKELSECLCFDLWDFKNGELTLTSYCKINGYDYGNTYKKLVKDHGLIQLKKKMAQLNINYWKSLE